MSMLNNVPSTRPLVLAIGARGVLSALVADAVQRHGGAVRRSSRGRSLSPEFQHVDLTGLVTTKLAAIDEGNWLSVWRWDSLASVKAAIAQPPSIPQAGSGGCARQGAHGRVRRGRRRMTTRCACHNGQTLPWWVIAGEPVGGCPRGATPV